MNKLTNNVLFQSFIGEDRGLRMYNKLVSGRLGISASNIKEALAELG